MAQAILVSKNTTDQHALYMSFELSDKTWRLTVSDGVHNASRFTVDSGDTAAVAVCIAKMKQRFKLPASAPVHTCYEAGRDGWWLHRWLLTQGIDNVVVDAASIEVNRRARRAKNDRLDGDKLLEMLLRYRRDGGRVWSVVRCPTVEQEDDRRSGRELQRLTAEQTAHRNRVGGLLVLHNLRSRSIGGRNWRRWWESHKSAVPTHLREEVDRECERLELVRQQMKLIEAQRDREIEAKKHPVAAQLCRLRAIGFTFAWRLDKELFGWRLFNNRRELGACLGLTPTPYDSGNSRVEQGISKTGNAKLRGTVIELAWTWLRFQPDSELSLWYARRFASGGKRMRRVGIVAMGRRLMIALWRYLQHGEIPKGAVLKPAAA